MCVKPAPTDVYPTCSPVISISQPSFWKPVPEFNYPYSQKVFPNIEPKSPLLEIKPFASSPTFSVERENLITLLFVAALNIADDCYLSF